jgi:hypothetical protein
MTRDEEIKFLTDSIEKLLPAVSKYNELNRRRSVLTQQKSKDDAEALYDKLISATMYTEPTYPAMGEAGAPGYAYFASEEQAKELVKVLTTSYYYAYVVVWGGPGDYRVDPTYKYDHDSEVIYTATFVKSQ